MNKCDCVLVVKQYGSNVAMELEPGESRPLHWADGSLEATLSVSVIPQAAGSTAATLMDWSGPVGIGNIGTFPICIRPMPGGAALPGKGEFGGVYVQSHTIPWPPGSNIRGKTATTALLRLVSVSSFIIRSARSGCTSSALLVAVRCLPLSAAATLHGVLSLEHCPWPIMCTCLFALNACPK